MYKLWFTLGGLAFTIAIFGYVNQEVSRHSMWDWEQFKTIEMAVSVATSVGVALLVAAVAVYVKSRNVRNR